MPVVIFAGIPSSGKTTRAEQLRRYLEEVKGKKVHVINEESLQLTREHVYQNSTNEKVSRGLIKASLERLASRDAVVIVDSLNYIKGYRYELYCISRGLKTPQCTIHCETSPPLAKQWNAARTDDHVTDAQFDELVMRFECPDAKNRWDAPLFTVQATDESLPLDTIFDVLEDSAKLPQPNFATNAPSLAPANVLHELDHRTQEIVTFLVANASSLLAGDAVAVPGTTQKFIVPATLTQAELRRLRRQFVTSTQSTLQLYSGSIGSQDVGKISTMFVQHLNASFQ